MEELEEINCEAVEVLKREFLNKEQARINAENQVKERTENSKRRFIKIVEDFRKDHESQLLAMGEDREGVKMVLSQLGSVIQDNLEWVGRVEQMVMNEELKYFNPSTVSKILP